MIPKEQLNTLLESIKKTPGNDVAQRATKMEVDVRCAIVMCDSLVGLSVAVADLANRGVTVANNAIKQSELSAAESSKMAAESANLSRQMNNLTRWIMLAAIASAVAATLQAFSTFLQLCK